MRHADAEFVAATWRVAEGTTPGVSDTLIYSAGGGNFGAAPGAVLREVNMQPAIRLLAYRDHAQNVSAWLRGESAGSVVIAVPPGFGLTAAVDDWLTSQLAEGEQAIRVLCGALRDNEGYRLIRFLLDQDAATPIAELGRLYGFSTSHFRRTCRAALGRSLKAELRALRAARSLLACSPSGRSFTEVSADFGYSSAAHFSADIRSLFGQSPTELFRPAVPTGFRP